LLALTINLLLCALLLYLTAPVGCCYCGTCRAYY